MVIKEKEEERKRKNKNNFERGYFGLDFKSD